MLSVNRLDLAKKNKIWFKKNLDLERVNYEISLVLGLFSNDANQTPQHGVLKTSLDEGGEFFFVRK